jgi:hypothetical protein
MVAPAARQSSRDDTALALAGALLLALALTGGVITGRAAQQAVRP